MKKIIITVVAVAVVVIGVIVFLLVGNNSGELFVLSDKYNSLEVSLKYPKNAGFITDDFNENYTSTYPESSFRNEEKNYEVTLSFRDTSGIAYDKALEYAKKKDNYSEVEYNKFAGYKYNADSFGKIEMVLKLKETDSGYIVLSLELDKIDWNNKEMNLSDIFNSKEFQKILKTLTFTDQVEGKVEVDGVLSENHKLLIKTIKTSNSDYTVNQYQDTMGGVMNVYVLNSDKSKYNNSGVYFRLSYYGNEGNYKDLATLQAYKEESSKNKYTDGNLFGYSVKIETPTSDLNSKYTRWDSGLMEKDGKVYEFLYYIYSDVDSSLGEELVKNVLNNSETKD